MKSFKTLLTALVILLLFTCQKVPILSQSIDNKTYDLSSLDWKLWGYQP
jgi:hypothetical protein